MEQDITSRISAGETDSTKKERYSNIELLRIITMVLIIAHHYVVNSGLMEFDGLIYANVFNWRSVFLLIFGAWGKIGINLFVLMTGYFMCTSKITARKFIKLLAEVMFYRLVIYSIFWVIGYEPFSLLGFIKILIPVTSIEKGFTNAFLAFYLCIPFLNTLIHNMDERRHFYLLMLCFFIYILLGSIPIFSITMNYLSWFIVVYFIASYIRLYPKRIYEKAKLWNWLAGIAVCFCVFSVIGCAWLGDRMHRHMAYGFVTDSNALLAIVSGIVIFMAFRNLKIKQSRIINLIAATTFGVFLIHTRGDSMRQWLWCDVLDNVGHYSSSIMPLHAIGSVIAIFIICSIIDFLRICLLEKPFFRLWDRNWNRIYCSFKKLERKLFSKLEIQE